MSVRFLICRESGFSNSRLKPQKGATAGEHGVCTRNNVKGWGEMRWGGSLEPGHTHRLNYDPKCPTLNALDRWPKVSDLMCQNPFFIGLLGGLSFCLEHTH